jgi:hypothetical protein
LVWTATKIITTTKGWRLVEVLQAGDPPRRHMLTIFKGSIMVFWGDVFDFSQQLRATGIPLALLNAMQRWVATQRDTETKLGMYIPAVAEKMKDRYGPVVANYVIDSIGDWALIDALDLPEIVHGEMGQPVKAIVRGDTVLFWGGQFSGQQLRAAGVPAQIIKDTAGG